MAKYSYLTHVLVRQSIHRPYIETDKEPLVLYTKVPEYDIVNGEDKVEQKYINSSKYGEYISKKDSNYNSPRNIRRLFIGASNILIQYLEAPIIKGNKNSNKIVKCKYYDKSVYDVISEKSVDNKVTLTGNVFKAITYPYVCSNIEEIYISHEIYNAAIQTDGEKTRVAEALSLKYDYIDKITNGINSGVGIVKNDIPKALFDSANISNESACSRLRTIAVIRNLDSMLDGISSTISNKFDGKRWYANENVIEQIKNTTACLVSEISSNNQNYAKIYKSENIYLYDRNVLSEIAERINKDIADTLKIKSEKSNETKTDLEKELDNIMERNGDIKGSLIIKVATEGIDRNSLIQTIEQFSKSGIDKYYKILNINRR